MYNKKQQNAPMTLFIMIFLIGMGGTIFYKYGISASSSAVRLGLYGSIIPLFWVLTGPNLLWGQKTQTIYSGGPYDEAENSMFLQTIPKILFRNIDSDSGISTTLETSFLNELFSASGRDKIPYFEDIYLFDGLSYTFILLTVIIIPITILASEKRSEMIASLLITEALLIGAFVTYDFITFYALFESVLIPMFFLIGAAGSGTLSLRVSAAYRLFIYTLGGSLFMLLALVYITYETGTQNWFYLVLKTLYPSSLTYETLTPPHILGSMEGSETHTLDAWRGVGLAIKDTITGAPVIDKTIAFSSSYWLFPLIFIAFAVKVPMVPFHLWLPEAHTLAPTPCSMILAALLLKLGGYGMIRWAMPLFPEACLYYSPAILILAFIGTLYACFTCFRQIDIKRIIAYSSIVHMNISIFAIFSGSPLALKGAIFEMFSHGYISSGLFFLIGILYSRHDSRVYMYFRGLCATMPLFGVCFLIFILANSAVPLTCGFVGEFIMFSGMISEHWGLTLSLSVLTVLNAGYNIWLYNRICFGYVSPYLPKMADLNRKEMYILASLCFWVILLGICPRLIYQSFIF